MSDDVTARDILSRNASIRLNVTFKDFDGNAFQPTQVEKRVVLAGGTIITDWTDITSEFTSGVGDVDLTADDLELQDTALVREKHIVLIVGDRTTSSAKWKRVIVPVKNPEKLRA